MDTQTRVPRVLPARRSLRVERHARAEVPGGETAFSEKGNKQTEGQDSGTDIRQHRREDKARHEDKEELSDPAYGYVSKETRISTLKGQVRPCVHCNIICSSHEVEASWASITDEWTTKRGYKHTTECGSALKKNGLSPPATAWQARAAMR